MLLLDIALDNYFRLCIERTDKNSLSGDSLMDLVGLVLSNACIAGESEDFGQVGSATLAFVVVMYVWVLWFVSFSKIARLYVCYNACLAGECIGFGQL